MLVSPIPGGRAVDLGCGPGDLTRDLHERIEAAETIGIDSSDAMLAKAAPHAGGGLRFERGDLAAFSPDGAVTTSSSPTPPCTGPRIIPALLARLTEASSPGASSPSRSRTTSIIRRTARPTEAASQEPFRTALSGTAHPRHVLAPEAYAAILDRLGYAEQTVRLQIYGHSPRSREGIVAVGRGVASVGVPQPAAGRSSTPVRRALPRDPVPEGPGRTALLFHLSPDPDPGAKVAFSASASLLPDRGETRVDSDRQTLTKR